MRILAFCLFLIASNAVASKIENLQHLSEYTQNIPALEIPSVGDIYAVFAHADDELTVLGELSSLAKTYPGRHIEWIIVSDNSGAKGSPIEDGGLSKAEIRHREAQAVAKCVGLQAPTMLNLPDGGIDHVEHLDQVLKEEFAKRGTGKVAAVFTHDSYGLYGHADHLAVRQAVEKIFAGTPTLIVAAAYPEYLQHNISFLVMKLKRLRPLDFAPITHRLRLNENLKGEKKCADHAYDSQRNLMTKFRKGMSIEDYYSALEFEFYNVYGK
jgi:LmbE family N-acetylglucosaminyl deacetylase